MNERNSSINSLASSNSTLNISLTSSLSSSPTSSKQFKSTSFQNLLNLGDQIQLVLTRLNNIWIELGKDEKYMREKEKTLAIQIENLLSSTIHEEINQKEEIIRQIQFNLTTIHQIGTSLNEFLTLVNINFNFYLLNSKTKTLGSFSNAKTFNSKIKLFEWPKKNFRRGIQTNLKNFFICTFCNLKL